MIPGHLLHGRSILIRAGDHGPPPEPSLASLLKMNLNDRWGDEGARLRRSIADGKISGAENVGSIAALEITKHNA